MTRSIHRFAAEDLRDAARRYRAEADQIRVLVVRHHSRDPDFGEARS